MFKTKKFLITSCILLITLLSVVFTGLASNELEEPEKMPAQVKENIKKANEKTKPSSQIISKVANPIKPEFSIEIIPHSEFDISGNLLMDIHLKSPLGEKLLDSIRVTDFWTNDLAIWLDESKLLLNYKRIYDSNTDSFEELKIPLSVWNANLSPDKNQIGYIGKTQKTTFLSACII